MDKQDWTYKKLGDICDIFGRIGFRGYTREDYVNTIEEGAISLSPSNIINNKLDFSNCTFITWDKYHQSPEIIISKDDVIFVKTASVGKCAYVSELPHESTINPQFVVFKNIKILNRFFFYELLSSSFQYRVKRITSGTSVPTITQKGLSELEISFPSNTEQERIVAELDLLSGIIEKKKAQLCEYDQLAQSIFYDMFGDPIDNPKGWEFKKLGDICTKISDGVHAKPKYTESGMPFISVVNINNGYLSFNGCKFVSFNDGEVINKRTRPEKGDILYTKVGATYGIPALVDTDTVFCLYVSVCLIKPKHDLVDSIFLRNLMALPYVKNQADDRIRGIGVPDLHLNQISSFNIILPPLSLQQCFAEKVEAIERQKALVQQSIEETQTMFDYTMDKYFG